MTQKCQFSRCGRKVFLNSNIHWLVKSSFVHLESQPRLNNIMWMEQRLRKERKEHFSHRTWCNKKGKRDLRRKTFFFAFADFHPHLNPPPRTSQRQTWTDSERSNFVKGNFRVQNPQIWNFLYPCLVVELVLHCFPNLWGQKTWEPSRETIHAVQSQNLRWVRSSVSVFFLFLFFICNMVVNMSRSRKMLTVIAKYVLYSYFSFPFSQKCLTTLDLTSLGVGSCCGTGMYLVVGMVARNIAGPGVILSFFIAAIASIFSGEFPEGSWNQFMRWKVKHKGTQDCSTFHLYRSQVLATRNLVWECPIPLARLTCTRMWRWASLWHL